MSAAAAAQPWPINSITRKEDGSISVDWGKSELTDEALEQFVSSRLNSLFECLPSAAPSSVIECCVDISENQLMRPEPIASLLMRLREAPLHITSLRLHKNQFTDVVAAALADHIKQAAAADRPLMQLHLSGNSLTSAGIRTLIEVAHNCGAYPRPKDAPRLMSMGAADSWRKALWLRVEHQKPPVLDAEELLRSCEAQGYPVTIVPKFERVPPHAVVQMHFGFLQPYPPDTKGDGKGKGYGKYGGDWQWQPAEQYGQKGKGKYKGKDWYAADGKGKGYSADGKGKGHSADGKGKGYAGDGKGKGYSADGKGRGKGGGKATAYGDTKGSWNEQQKGSASAWLGPEQDSHRESPAAVADASYQAKGSGKVYEAKGYAKGGWTKGKANGAEEYSEKGGGKAKGKTKGKASGGDWPGAHGKANGKGKARGDGAAHDEIMSWLKENRDRSGPEGEFEVAWKSWCREHELSNQVKSDRVASIAGFRDFWEGGHGAVARQPASREQGAPPLPPPPPPARASAGAGAGAASAAAPDPSDLDSRAPAFATKQPDAKAPPAETNEEAMLRLLGDKLLKKPAAGKDDAATAPHQGPSWEAGPPLAQK